MLTKVVKKRHTSNVNEMQAMKNIIQFTCPRCGGHQLMLVERAMHRYVVQNLEVDRQGRLAVGLKVLVDDLCGEPLGYRCADCRHPDCHGNDSSEGSHPWRESPRHHRKPAAEHSLRRTTWQRTCQEEFYPNYSHDASHGAFWLLRFTAIPYSTRSCTRACVLPARHALQYMATVRHHSEQNGLLPW